MKLRKINFEDPDICKSTGSWFCSAVSTRLKSQISTAQEPGKAVNSRCGRCRTSWRTELVTDKTFSSVRSGPSVLFRLVSGSSLAASSICGGKHIRKRKGYHLPAVRKQHKISCRPSIMRQTKIRIAAASAGQSSHVLARSASHVFAFHDWRFLLPTKIMGSRGPCQGPGKGGAPREQWIRGAASSAANVVFDIEE